MSQTNPKVDAYIARAKQWQPEFQKLRKLALSCGLAEDLKWGKPCYTFEESNIAIVQGFKESIALMFFKGSLMKDPDGVMEKPGPNSHAASRIPFTSVKQITEMTPLLKAYIAEAVALEKAGAKVGARTNSEPVPEELQAKLDETAAFAEAFHALTPGRQRAYILHFSGAKQSSTRVSRIEKCVPRILAGKGLNDE